MAWRDADEPLAGRGLHQVRESHRRNPGKLVRVFIVSSLILCFPNAVLEIADPALRKTHVSVIFNWLYSILIRDEDDEQARAVREGHREPGVGGRAGLSLVR